MSKKNESEPVKTNPDETKPDETGTNEPEPVKPTLKPIKEHPMYFEVPVPQEEALWMMTKYMKENRHMEVIAHTGRYNEGRLMVGVLPSEADTTGYDVGGQQ